ncbi:tyrosine-type recombinase/integrase [Chloroflexota bacterium]
MRGHIVQRAKNSYSLKFSIGKDPTTGKPKNKWVTVHGGKKDAEKKLSELLHQLDTGSYIQPGKTTVAEYLERWLVDYAKHNLSPRTVEGYEKIARRYLIPALGGNILTNLKPEHLQKFYSQELQRNLSPQTVRHHHTMIHKALRDAVGWGLLTLNVADAVKPPKAQPIEMQAWCENEVIQFLEAAKSTPYYEIFYLALFTGMRRSELLALRWQDIDFILGQIYINRSVHVLKGGKVHFRTPKTAKGKRTIDLTPSTMLTLNEYRKKKEAEALMLDKPILDNDLLFGDLRNKPILPDTLSHNWLKVVRKVGLKVIRLHDARHTHASLMLKQGVHPKIVQERLGHASIQITLDTYSHVTSGLQQAAANNFDRAFTGKYNKQAIGAVEQGG